MSSSVKKMNKFDFVQGFELLLVQYSNAYIDYVEESCKPCSEQNPCVIRRYVHLKCRIAKFELLLYRNLPSLIEVD